MPDVVSLPGFRGKKMQTAAPVVSGDGFVLRYKLKMHFKPREIIKNHTSEPEH